eukprot:5545214-Ditylum_brightwellii.AAC.1
MKVDKSCNSIDAFAKEIYKWVFDWLVWAINGATSVEHNYEDAAEEYEFKGIAFGDVAFSDNS